MQNKGIEFLQLLQSTAGVCLILEGNVSGLATQKILHTAVHFLIIGHVFFFIHYFNILNRFNNESKPYL